MHHTKRTLLCSLLRAIDMHDQIIACFSFVDNNSQQCVSISVCPTSTTEIIFGATSPGDEGGISPGLNIDANWMLGLTTFGMFLPFDPRVVAKFCDLLIGDEELVAHLRQTHFDVAIADLVSDLP